MRILNNSTATIKLAVTRNALSTIQRWHCFPFFDPWEDLDTFSTALAIRLNAFRWIHQPEQLTHHRSRSGQPSTPAPLSEKFRVQLNVAGFNPETINTKVDVRKVIAEAKQEDRQNDDDFNIRHLRKTYERTT